MNPQAATKIRSAVWAVIRTLLIIGISYVILFPLLSKIASSLMSEVDLYDKTVLWVPRHPTLEHYVNAFRLMTYPKSFLNSLALAAVAATLQLATCSLVGYGLARFRAATSGLVFAMVILTLIVPPQMIALPQYLNFRYFNIYGLLPGQGLNLLNTFWPIVLMSLTGVGFRNGLFIYIMREHFRGMPGQLEEAAYVDGAGPLQTFYKVMLPGAAPAMTVVFIFAFVWQWNDYYFTQLFMGGSSLLVNSLDGLARSALVDKGILLEQIAGPYASLMNNTGCLLFIAPLLIMYLVLQRYFVESIERTGIIG
jgi:multiple sugar transport system permease protein